MKTNQLLALLACLPLLNGCREKADSRAEPPARAPQKHSHQHTPPHGGTAVVLGAEEYHLEFVLDPAAGRLRAWVLDAHMDKFIRVTNESFAVQAEGRAEPLVFQAEASQATGETLGDTSAFAAQAGWLRDTTNFNAVIPALPLRSKIYRDVKFNFPRGNE